MPLTTRLAGVLALALLAGAPALAQNGPQPLPQPTPQPTPLPTPQPIGTQILAVLLSGSGSVSFTDASQPDGGNIAACSTSCTRSFNSNAQVALKAAPLAGYSFAGWTGACTGSGSCTVAMTSGKSVSAAFNALPAGTGPLIKWRAPRTLANGAPIQGLSGYRIYGSQTQYDLSPRLLLTVPDASATSANAPAGLASGTWYFWVSATTSSVESELQFNSKAVLP